MPLLFSVTLFLSALLLFMVQPMVGKMILPLLGGSPAAWNTCMVFFQALLLIGYLYSHRLAGRPGRTSAQQKTIHIGLLLTAIVWLLIAAFLISPRGNPIPVLPSLAPQGEAYPMFGALALLGVAIGLPFFVLSTTSPLLQKWFVATRHPAGRDPYFLSATSNAGSLFSLTLYPFVVEPSLTLSQQSWVWAVGFLIFAALVAFCGQAAANPLPPIRGGLPAPIDSPKAGPRTPLPRGKALRWVALSFVPSSLMLGVTFHMTTDIASVPLLWIIPLAMYLLTFIIAFSTWTQVWWYRPLLANISPVMTLLLVFVMTAALPKLSTALILSLHLGAFFFAALMLHSELAHDRPAPEHLTDFWLWISVGGVLGGLFNALLAPMLFPFNMEYPIAIGLGCLLVPKLLFEDSPEPAKAPYRYAGLLDILIPLMMITAVSWLIVLPDQNWFANAMNNIAAAISRLMQFSGIGFALNGSFLSTLLVYALPCVFCFLFIDRPLRFGLCVSAILAVWVFITGNSSGVLRIERSFFGILRVESNAENWPCFDRIDTDPNTPNAPPAIKVYRQPVQLTKLSHGTTLHGVQGAIGYNFPLRDNVPAIVPNPWAALTYTAMAGFYAIEPSKPAQTATVPESYFVPGAYDFRQDPLTYYHRTGPVGEIFQEMFRTFPNGDVAMIGLGTGSVACYARPGQQLTFYEIDPTVIQLVEPSRYFSYLHDAKKRGAKLKFILGDARLKLEENRDAKYHLLLVDAFSSDSIPVHLLTREAVKLYTDRLADGGLLALHISNRYIDLEPVVARLADDLQLTARVWNDGRESDHPGKTMSTWVVLAKNADHLSDPIRGDESDSRIGALMGGYGYHIYNHHWRPLEVLKDVPAWTDDYSDVLRVMRLKEVQSIRRWLGFPTPVAD